MTQPARYHLVVVVGLVGLLCACGDSSEDPTVRPEPAARAPSAPELASRAAAVTASDVDPACLGEDAAWVERAMLAVWGRHPLSHREVAVWVEVVEAQGRAEAVRAMTRSEAARDRFTEVIADLLSINRFGERVNEPCARTTLPEVTGALAAHVRDTTPLGLPFESPWTMTDLIHSALALDDLSPIFRAQLFGQHGSRVIDADDPDDEVSFRQLYAGIFERSWLNRRMDCMRCHNTEYSVVKEHHFPVPGHVERALYGNSGGRADADLNIFFRVVGVLSMDFIPDATGLDFWEYGDGESPWGMSAVCGQFLGPDQITPDPFGSSGYFIREFGPTASIWDLEALLHTGFEALRGRELDIEPDTQTVAGEPAFAWMVSMRVAEGIWEALTGHPLTTPNFFPRNPDQRDLLRHLSEVFVTEGYSLTELLVAALTHPWFVPGAPADCGPTTPYDLPAIFDPWVDLSEVDEQRNNSVGDLIVRLEPRVLLTAAAAALEWPAPDLLSLVPEDYDPETETEEEPPELERLATLQTNLGLFVSDSETGFRGSNFRETLAWEEAFGACRAPWVAEPRPDDFVDRLASTAPTMGDAVAALKDRLHGDPGMADAEERALLEALAGQSFDTPMSALADTEPLRRVCAALLASPQFLLGGLPSEPVLAGSESWVAPGTGRADFCATAEALSPGFTCP